MSLHQSLLRWLVGRNHLQRWVGGVLWGPATIHLKIFLQLLFYNTGSYAALQAADLDLIFRSGYSSGGYIWGCSMSRFVPPPDSSDWTWPALSSVIRHPPSVISHQSSVIHHTSSFLRRLSSAIRRTSSVIRHPPPLSVICQPSSVIRHLSSIIRHLSSAVRHPSSAVRHLSSISRHQSSIFRHPSSVDRHPSSVIRHPSPVICWPSSVFRHLSSIIPHLSSIILYPSSVTDWKCSFFVTDRKRDWPFRCLDLVFVIWSHLLIQIQPHIHCSSCQSSLTYMVATRESMCVFNILSGRWL